MFMHYHDHKGVDSKFVHWVKFVFALKFRKDPLRISGDNEGGNL